MVDVGNVMVEVYGKQLPRYITKSIQFILKRIPISDFLFRMQNDLRNNEIDNKAKGKTLYSQLDDYIQTTFFKQNSMIWMVWVLPLNVVIQIAIFVYFK